MQDWIRIWMIILEFSAFTYLLIMFIINYGWYTTKTFIPSNIGEHKGLSILIAVRNEETKISDLLNSIQQQNYPTNLVELIIVDDHSEDKTVEIINEYKITNPDFNLILLESVNEGKKAAIAQGIEYSTNEIIILTDGDCEIISPDWLINYLSFFDNTDAHLVFGPVVYRGSNNLLKRIFSLEFISLVSSGAGSAGMHLTLMGNGANLAFRKSSYSIIKSKMKGSNFASGDDVFLMHSMSSHFGNNAVKFIKSGNSLVETEAPDTIKKFVNQRVRWGSKAKAYSTVWPLLVSISVFIFSLTLVVTALLSFFEIWFLAVFALFILLKFLVDYPLIKNFIRTFDRPNYTYLLFPLEFLYPFYILLTALFSFFIPYQWKGRKKIK